jgi:ATP-dependent phosphofructokinase / diphosphate-dependent phosphofructokinase
MPAGSSAARTNLYLARTLAMKIGVLTGGGDCPGLNAVIRAIVRKGSFHYGDEFVGFLEGWRGLVEDKTMPLDLSTVAGILPRGGTILRTSRTNPSKHSGGLQRCTENLKKHNCDALIAIGGDDTLSVAQKLFQNGVKVVGVPKTIDNDLAGTDFTFGFDTAVNVATEMIDRVHTTAEAHNRVIVVEVMGRDSGWIAAYSGIGGGADVILVPEVPFDIEQVAELIRQRHARGRYFSIVVAAEGAKFAGGAEMIEGAPVLQDIGRDEFGHLRLGGIGSVLAREIERRTGFETRSVVLGHIQRGGTPSAFDRVLATRYGLGAIDMVHRGEFGHMAALRGNKIISIPLTEALSSNRKVDKEILDAATGILDKLEEKAAKIS